jgi:hypothetical protein
MTDAIPADFRYLPSTDCNRKRLAYVWQGV